MRQPQEAAAPHELHASLLDAQGRIEAEMARHARTMAAIQSSSHAAPLTDSVHSTLSCDSAPSPFKGTLSWQQLGGCGGGGGGGGGGNGDDDEGDPCFDSAGYTTAGPDDLSVLLDVPEPWGVQTTSTTSSGGRLGSGGGRGGRSPMQSDTETLLLLEGDGAQGTDDDAALEKRIFVKAALQLLVERTATTTPLPSWEDSSSTGNGGSLLLGRTDRLEEASAAGVKKAGMLRKANHHSMGTIWRTKHVWLYPGLLIYVDDDPLLGRRKKCLPLHAGVCSVRPIPSKKNNVFELASRKRAKRLWMCASEGHRAEWLQAIAEATMPAGLLGPEGLDGVGPYAPFLHDMRHYRDARSDLGAARDRDGYLRAVGVLAQATEEEELRVPFAWVRAQIAMDGPTGTGVAPSAPSPSPSSSASRNSAHFFPTTPARAHRKRSSAAAGEGAGAAPPATIDNPQAELQQLWKDMARDKVCINGRVFHGKEAEGPEAILGALARTITQLAAKARELEVAASTAAATTDAQPESSQRQCPQQQPPPPPPSLGALTEEQVVAHTLEILLACNRTHSGGDTYACVEYLFRNRGLVVVCPYSSHAEPLQISLELLWAGEQQQHPQHGVGSGSRPSSVNFSGPSSAAVGVAAPPAHQVSSLSRSTSFSSRGTFPSIQLPASPIVGDLPQRPVSSSASSASASLALILDPAAPLGASFPRSLPWSAPAAMNARAHAHYADAGHPHHYFSSTGGSTLGETTTSAATAPPFLVEGGERYLYQQRQRQRQRQTECNGRRPVILVRVQANTAYKVCPLDPQDDDGSDIWVAATARFEQRFTISGCGLAKGQETIYLRTLLTGGCGGAGGLGAAPLSSGASVATPPPKQVGKRADAGMAGKASLP